ncbi:MAG: hypothetical protein CVU87_12565 [Firmicutes bacterium HGW-Firmicutes-12]|jgi:small acid-soluble spore protein F (minor alpha/beta-type SASP)|nr:MAG: hypothetical protein CVU87_12565 [Firmicutes bacterium HGW-Firmicutes-12]
MSIKKRGGLLLAKNRSVMSNNLKMEIAKELGFFNSDVAHGDFGNVSSRNCGTMVKSAIEIAERSLK